MFGEVLEIREGKKFQVNSEEWGVFFELYENGYMPVVYNPENRRNIPLLMSEDAVQSTLAKLEGLEENVKYMPFTLFRAVVIGAVSLSVKYF
jgi:hypothetical protein